MQQPSVKEHQFRYQIFYLIKRLAVPVSRDTWDRYSPSRCNWSACCCGRHSSVPCPRHTCHRGRYTYTWGQAHILTYLRKTGMFVTL